MPYYLVCVATIKQNFYLDRWAKYHHRYERLEEMYYMVYGGITAFDERHNNEEYLY